MPVPIHLSRLHHKSTLSCSPKPRLWRGLAPLFSHSIHGQNQYYHTDRINRLPSKHHPKWSSARSSATNRSAEIEMVSVSRPTLATSSKKRSVQHTRTFTRSCHRKWIAATVQYEWLNVRVFSQSNMWMRTAARSRRLVRTNVVCACVSYNISDTLVEGRGSRTYKN